MEQNPIIISDNINFQPNIENQLKDKDKYDSENQHLLKEINTPKKSNDDNIIENSLDYNNKKNENSNIKEEFIINRKGNMLMFLYNKDGEPLIVIGPDWQLAFLMFIVIDVMSICYFYFLWDMLFKFMRIIGIIIFINQMGFYLITILMNPGIPSKDLWLENYKYLDDIGSYRICNICKIIMRNKDKTDHCDECNTCIIGADHHCPWTSKCVGKKNKRMFYLFVSSTFALLTYFFCGAISFAFIDDNPRRKKIN